ncbi:hypothetical protein FA13DRAFT_1692380 [Coprinellus micaceus]|uniref:FYVE-type domain-containing protein n=1 Tax=Coprinellus micaceus TaxID=71717 RepID=A0A4Y7SWS4_COPMI|nr:hypothetical protein FA13DRAFT_1692380 [Coprinellus micaceus]
MASLCAESSTPRANDHLAVLLPRHLWKPDSVSSACDNVYCRVPFSLFERRHHCRKCGGCFCHACTARSTPLLDTSNLPFVYPPRSHRIADYAGPDSPVLDARVCDDCFDQLRGVLSSRSSASTSPSSRTRSLRDRAPSPASTASLRSTHSNPSPLSHAPPARARPSHARSHPSSPNTLRAAPLPLCLEKSYGELDAYPLKRSSVLCKATGGGRWEPTPITVLDGYRKPVVGGKAPYEVMMEAEEEEERRRKANPVVVDGDFQYRWVVGARRGD